MNEDDYRSVVDRMRLADGTVWSIPITLSVEEEQAAKLSIGERVALVGGRSYRLCCADVESIYKVDQQHEARQVFKTDETAHPGVAKLYRTVIYICRRTDYRFESTEA